MTIRVGFDYDEPIFPWYDYAHDASVAAGLTSSDAPPPTRWDPHSQYGCTIDEWFAVLDREVEKGDEGMYMRPCKASSVEWVNRLYDGGYEVYLITARGSFGTLGHVIKDLTKRQIEREGIKNHGLYFAPDKMEVIRDLRLDYFIDDRPKHFAEAMEAGADAYLLDERWNRDFEVPYSKRVYSVPEFARRIVRRHGYSPNQRVFTEIV